MDMTEEDELEESSLRSGRNFKRKSSPDRHEKSGQKRLSNRKSGVSSFFIVYVEVDESHQIIHIVEYTGIFRYTHTHMHMCLHACMLMCMAKVLVWLIVVLV